MDQQEIEKLRAESEEITKRFRESLSPAIDENGNPRMLTTDVQLLTVTSNQIHEYIQQIQNLLKPEEKEPLLLSLILVNLSGLYVIDNIKITGELPYFFCTGTTFKKEADFSSAIFNGSVYFYGTTFNSVVNFSNVTFKSKAIFGDISINNNFKRTTFEKGVSFSSALFLQKADFSSVTFNGWVHFSGAVFKAGAYFSNFPVVGNLSKSDYLQKINSSAILNQASFYNTVFEGISSFYGVIFNWVEFRYTTFGKEGDSPYFHQANFSGATFNTWINFSNAIFNVSAVFDEANFNDATIFSGTKFNNIADFSNAIFKKESHFNNAQFKDGTSFSQCEFENTPFFHETILHQDTSFEETKFNRCKTEDDYRAYRTLKQHMSDVHATLEESRFFALEQRTRLKLDEELYQKGKKELLSNIIISKFYAGISDYGQNTAKPLILLAVTWLLFALFFSLPNMVVLNVEYKAEWVKNVIGGVAYSTQNILNPLSVLGKDLPFFASNWVVLFLGHIQSLLSVAFIALWLLAVRRRFQKGE